MARIRDRTTPAQWRPAEHQRRAREERHGQAASARGLGAGLRVRAPREPAKPHPAQAERDEKDAGRALGKRQVFEQQPARRAGAGAERDEHEREAGQERERGGRGGGGGGSRRTPGRSGATPGETSEQNPAPKAASSVGVSSITSL